MLLMFQQPMIFLRERITILLEQLDPALPLRQVSPRSVVALLGQLEPLYVRLEILGRTYVVPCKCSRDASAIDITDMLGALYRVLASEHENVGVPPQRTLPAQTIPLIGIDRLANNVSDPTVFRALIAGSPAAAVPGIQSVFPVPLRRVIAERAAS